MTVIVGGKEAQAYGTACLQPDGSWYRGPAKVVSR
jgi:surface antigen